MLWWEEPVNHIHRSPSGLAEIEKLHASQIYTSIVTKLESMRGGQTSAGHHRNFIHSHWERLPRG